MSLRKQCATSAPLTHAVSFADPQKEEAAVREDETGLMEKPMAVKHLRFGEVSGALHDHVPPPPTIMWPFVGAGF